ncbi:MAG: DUF6677 family protein, partial [Phycisphaerae bacterium]|nr:DUF6677 family protein [Phycisphaerae bacterium]
GWPVLRLCSGHAGSIETQRNRVGYSVPMASGPSDDQRINLGAALAGWVLPGLGHIMLGERRRGFFAMAGVMILLLTGLLVGGLDCVDRDEDRLWFVGQACAGPLVIGASFANDALIKSGRVGKLLDPPIQSGRLPPGTPPPPRVSTFKGLAHPNEFGTLLVFLAGLMNLVVILDAIVREPLSPAMNSLSGRRSSDGGGRTA